MSAVDLTDIINSFEELEYSGSAGSYLKLASLLFQGGYRRASIALINEAASRNPQIVAGEGYRQLCAILGITGSNNVNQDPGEEIKASVAVSVPTE